MWCLTRRAGKMISAAGKAGKGHQISSVSLLSAGKQMLLLLDVQERLQCLCRIFFFPEYESWILKFKTFWKICQKADMNIQSGMRQNLEPWWGLAIIFLIIYLLVFFISIHLAHSSLHAQLAIKVLLNFPLRRACISSSVLHFCSILQMIHEVKLLKIKCKLNACPPISILQLQPPKNSMESEKG